MSQYNIAEAKAPLPEFARRALVGEEVVIAGEDTPAVRLVPAQLTRGPRQPGSGEGQLLWMAPDFAAIPEGFEGYI